MYRRRNQHILPLTTSDASNPSPYDARSTFLAQSKKFAKLQPYTKATYIWLLISMLLCIFGAYHCHRNLHWTELLCTPEGCHLDHRPPKRLQSLTGHKPIRKLFLPRSSLVSTKLVCVNYKGEVIEPTAGKECGKPGTNTFDSYTLVYNSNLGDKEMLNTFVVRSSYRVAKYRNRSEYNRLRMYIQERTQTFKMKDDVLVTWQGLVGITFGLLNIIFCLIFGQFQDPPSRKTVIRKQ